MYAHLAPEAWHQDYHRLAFHVPGESARVFEIVRHDRRTLAAHEREPHNQPACSGC
ncbi:MAG TPA: hypothetical protein VF516_24050 [Kofleriaceae bacterium]